MMMLSSLRSSATRRYRPAAMRHQLPCRPQHSCSRWPAAASTLGIQLRWEVCCVCVGAGYRQLGKLNCQGRKSLLVAVLVHVQASCA